MLPHPLIPPSTLHTFLRPFTFPHMPQLHPLTEPPLTPPYPPPPPPPPQPITIHPHSTICEIHSHHKQRAAFPHSHMRCYHPLLPTRPHTPDILHLPQPPPYTNTARHAELFLNQLPTPLRHPPPSPALLLRPDSPFSSKHLIHASQRHSILFSIPVPHTKPIPRPIPAIPERASQTIHYPPCRETHVPQTAHRPLRLVVRLTPLVHPQPELFPHSPHHPFVTHPPRDTIPLHAYHLAHPVCELPIRYLNTEPLSHSPSTRFFPNPASLLIPALPHNLVRYTSAIPLSSPPPFVPNTVRPPLLLLPPLITLSRPRPTLHLPSHSPSLTPFLTALAPLRAVVLTTSRPTARPPIASCRTLSPHVTPRSPQS